MTSEHPVLIVGAGIAGLTAARLLQEYGIPVMVFEKTSADRGQGYGITARDWALEPVLQEMGGRYSFADLQRAVAVDRGTGGRGRVDLTFRNNGTGETLFNPDPSSTGPEPALFRANRSFLRDWLAEGVDVKYEHEVESLAGGPGLVTVGLRGGAVHRGSVVVAADGVHSTVRGLVLPHIQPEVLPVVLFHGKVRMGKDQYDAFVRTSLGSSNVTAGVGDGFNTFLTVADATTDGVQLDWSYSRARRGDRDPLWMPDRAEVIKVPQHLLKEIRGRALAPPFSTLVNADAIKKASVYNWRIRSVTMARAELDAAAGRGVVLVGDAAHAMPIFGGEGGNHAVLDGVDLFRTIRAEWEARGQALGPAGVSAASRAFYDGAAQRGREAVLRCTRRFSSFHQSIGEWEKVAEMAKRSVGAHA